MDGVATEPVSYGHVPDNEPDGTDSTVSQLDMTVSKTGKLPASAMRVPGPVIAGSIPKLAMSSMRLTHTDDDNTIIIYTTDHGEQQLEHGLESKGPAMYEESTRVPFIVYVPPSLVAKSAGVVRPCKAI